MWSQQCVSVDHKVTLATWGHGKVGSKVMLTPCTSLAPGLWSQHPDMSGTHCLMS